MLHQRDLSLSGSVSVRLWPGVKTEDMTHNSMNIKEGKRCLKVLKTLTNLKRRIAAAVLNASDKPTRKPVRVSQLSKCPFHLSITSLDKHQDSHSIDTVMTWLDESSTSLQQEVYDNRLNERLEAICDRFD